MRVSTKALHYGEALKRVTLLEYVEDRMYALYIWPT